MAEDIAVSIATIIIFLLLVIYVIGGTLMEVRHVLFGHETGVAILLGFLISLILKLTISGGDI